MSSFIKASIDLPLVEDLSGGLSAVGADGSPGPHELREVLLDGDDLGSLEVVGAHEAVLGGDEVVDGSRLADVGIANLCISN
jgi:hypothetical protein